MALGGKGRKKGEPKAIAKPVWQFKPIIPPTQDVEVEGSGVGDHFSRIINETRFQPQHTSKGL
jgi:hypothetical protein